MRWTDSTRVQHQLEGNERASPSCAVQPLQTYVRVWGKLKVRHGTVLYCTYIQTQYRYRTGISAWIDCHISHGLMLNTHAAKAMYYESYIHSHLHPRAAARFDGGEGYSTQYNTYNLFMYRTACTMRSFSAVSFPSALSSSSHLLIQCRLGRAEPQREHKRSGRELAAEPSATSRSPLRVRCGGSALIGSMETNSELLIYSTVGMYVLYCMCCTVCTGYVPTARGERESFEFRLPGSWMLWWSEHSTKLVR